MLCNARSLYKSCLVLFKSQHIQIQIIPFQMIWSEFTEVQLDDVFEYYKLIYSVDEENNSSK